MEDEATLKEMVIRTDERVQHMLEMLDESNAELHASIARLRGEN